MREWSPEDVPDLYFQSLGQARFKGDRLSGEALAEFFATGEVDIAHSLWVLNRHFSCPERFTHSLDFGCGVGRHLPALLKVSDQVSGVDVARAMLKRARHHAPHAMLSIEIPDGPFDWINSLLVFQQILPQRGYDLLEQLLIRAAPNACLSLQFVVKRDPAHKDASDGLYIYALPEIYARLSAQGFSRSVTEYLPGTDAGVRIISARGAFAV